MKLQTMRASIEEKTAPHFTLGDETAKGTLIFSLPSAYSENQNPAYR